MFFRLIRAGFNQRRKNLANSLSQILSISKSDIINILEKNNINSNYRAENLKFEDWANLSNDIYKLRSN